MISVDIRVGQNNVQNMLSRIQKELAAYPQDAEVEFKKLTPVRTGNARRHTALNGQKTEIRADYPYAQRLDDGYSPQAPRGMTDPFLKWSQRRITHIFRSTP